MTDTPARVGPRKASGLPKVAERKDVSPAFLYKEARAGRLKLSKLGTRTVIYDDDEAEYDALIKSEAEARRQAGKKPDPNPETPKQSAA